MIARDAGWTLEPGLDVYDKGGEKVGYVDRASYAQRCGSRSWASACKASGSRNEIAIAYEAGG